ncbi:hypothetical protein [Phreatobacter oligotrophus]|uniref:hypothetical protein n=1 Tax=Phreatobacter oligotrophus TaxID=1122261 RepID=UPI002352CFEB|nr:hypothetical protein [Phreatobacter oligotrophus]MBX9990211.1 hypothetical protein [Phreatobacter oligotrophus]
MKLVSVSQNMQRPNGLSELEILRQLTGGFASFGNAVRVSAISDAQKSKVLAELAEASNRVMDATNAYLFALGEARKAMDEASAKAPQLKIAD